MAEVKIAQKIPMKAFGVIAAQLKGEGVHVISRGAFKSGKVAASSVLGRVVSAFNLGAKIAVDADGACDKDARFEKLGEVYYLVLK